LTAFAYRWLYENIEAVRSAVDSGTALFGTIDTWLIWQLTGGRHTGVHVTDGTWVIDQIMQAM
jgi:glycerol kinase